MESGRLCELIARLKLGGDESVLDVGSGAGEVTAEIASALPRGRVVGLDGSPEMVEFARAHYDGNRFPKMVRLEVEALKR